MAWSLRRQLASIQNKTSQTVTTGTTGQSIAIDEAPYVAIAFDNTATASGDNNEVVSVTIGALSLVKVAEWTNAAAAGAGVTVSLWFARSDISVASGATLTVTFAAATVAKAIASESFRKTAGFISTLYQKDATYSSEVDAGDTGAITAGSLRNTEHLFIRATAVEGPTATSTVTSGYTAGAQNIATAGGVADTNVAIVVEWRILTATTSTSDPTLTDTTTDTAAVFAAITEVPPQSRVLTAMQAVKRAASF